MHSRVQQCLALRICFVTGSVLLGERPWFLAPAMRTLCNYRLTNTTLFSSQTHFFRLHVYTPNCLMNVSIQTFHGHLRFNTSKTNIMLILCQSFLSLFRHAPIFQTIGRKQKNPSATTSLPPPIAFSIYLLLYHNCAVEL